MIVVIKIQDSGHKCEMLWGKYLLFESVCYVYDEGY
jgi:hypothetical protein